MAKSNLDILTKKMIKLMSLKKLQKKIMFLMKPKNLYKVLILLAILGVLYFIRQKFLVKEGMSCSAENFESDIEGKKSLVLFHADWCGHCKNFMPEWDKISSEVDSMDGQSVTLLKVECGDAKENNKHKEIMEKYNIKGYPTIISFDESGNHSEYEGERSKSGIFQFLGINENAVEGFSEGMTTCEEYFEIPLKTAATAGDHVLVFDADQSFNFSAKGGERPVLDGSIVKGVTIDSVATSADDNGWKVTVDTSFIDMGSIDDYGGNKFHVITNDNTSEVSGNELCKGFVQADWEKDPVAGNNYFYVNEKDASTLSSGMYLSEGYGVVMPPHVYRSYVDSSGTDLRVVLCNGRDCESVVNEDSGATPDPQVITADIVAGTTIRFIKQPKDSNWTNPFGEGQANNGGTPVTG